MDERPNNHKEHPPAARVPEVTKNTKKSTRKGTCRRGRALGCSSAPLFSFVFFVLLRVFVVLPLPVAATALLAAPALATPPQLSAVDGTLPPSVRTGEKYLFRIQYSDAEGDRPQEGTLVTEGQEGLRRWPAETPTGGTADYKNGSTLEFTAGPFESGQHRAHFEVASVDGKDRYPSGGGTLTFNVENVLMKWIELAIGLAVALLFLPLIMFVLVRAVNPRSDPSRAARFGLLVGIVASYALFVVLFSGLYPLPWILVLGILALGAMFALVPRRV
jgi:hypothetical protein